MRVSGREIDLRVSPLPTNDAISAVVRMTDLGVERFLISSSLRGVLTQRLVRCICPHCQEKQGTLSEFGYQPAGRKEVRPLFQHRLHRADRPV